MKKRRLSFRLENDEALVIAPVDFWKRASTYYRETAVEFPEEAEGWLMAADHIDEWVERTCDKRANAD